MLRSMFSGVSGLRNHQTKMDVIGNNIANVNTVAFKKSRVTFQDMLSQTQKGASAPQNNRGGTNPQQVGLGMTVGSIDTIHTGSGIQTTGKMTDLAVDGDGFFLVRQGSDEYYTRAGNFDFDAEGNLCIPSTGLKVMGWDFSKVTDKTYENLGQIKITKGQPIEANSTTGVTYANNLDADTDVGETIPVTIKIFDSLGAEHILFINLTKTADNQWDYATEIDGTATETGNLAFDSFGNLDMGASGINAINFTPTNGAEPMVITPNFDKVTQNFNETTIIAQQNGNRPGSLKTITIDTSGTVTGVFDNGINKALAQIALVNFDNPAGLLKLGQNMYKNSNNSGELHCGVAGNGGLGTIAPSSLEMSNVDLSEEFTEMIITQRGFQANSRIITTSDEMLQELVNLKR